MSYSLKIFIFLACTLSGFLTTSAYANNKQEFRADPWYFFPDKSQLDVVAELPSGTAAPVAENFKLRLNGQEAATAFSVMPFQQSGQELAWLVCIQSTSALYRTESIKKTQTALLSLFNDRRTLKVALFTFGNTLNKNLSFKENTDSSSLTDAVAQLQPLEKLETKLYDSLTAALDYYEEAAKATNFPKRKRLLVIADGHDENSVSSYNNVIDRANALGIPIDTVSIKPLPKVSPNTMSLDIFAQQTGGRFVSATDETNLDSALTNIYKLLTQTQAVVVSFKYPAVSSQPIKSAEIKLQLPSTVELPLAALSHPENIVTNPAPPAEVAVKTNTPVEPVAVKPVYADIGLWLTVGIILLLIFVLFRFVRIRRLPE